MNQVLIAISVLLFVVMHASASSDEYEKACPAGSKCYGAKGNYSAMGYRGCIRTFDCNVQINMVRQKNKHFGGFEYFYFVCIRAPNSTLTMFFTPDINNMDGRGAIQAKIKVTKDDLWFKSFILDGDKEVSLKPIMETAKVISGFHTSNMHLVEVKDLNDTSRGLGDVDKDEVVDPHSAPHSAEGVPILQCHRIVTFFSQSRLFYHEKTSSGTNITDLDLKHSQKLYLKFRLQDAAGAEIENVSITLHEPGSGRAGVIFIVLIAVVVFLVCTKCFNYCLSCRDCLRKEPTDVEAQAVHDIEV